MNTDHRENDLQILKKEIESGASWFYWITGLSLINVVLALAKSDVHFIAGSSFAEVGAAFFNEGSSIGETLGVIVIILTLGFFVAMGRLANKPLKWAFACGMFIYGIDGLIFLVASDFIPAIFHIYVLYRLYTGMQAIPAYNELQRDVMNNPIQIDSSGNNSFEEVSDENNTTLTAEASTSSQE